MPEPPALSLNISEPLWLSTRRGWVETIDLGRGLATYSHTIQALGGYYTAGIGLGADLARGEDWLERLGYHVVVTGADLAPCWEGFVNRVTVQAGPRQVSLGPLLSIANRVYLVYSTVDTSTNPPTVGQRVRTATVNDTDSQGRWGIRAKVLSTGGCTDTDAANIVNRYVAERAEPKPSGTWMPAGGGLGVTVECLGYVHLLDYPYNQTATTGDMDLSDDDGTGKLQDILDAEPNRLAGNAIFSNDYHWTSDNTLQVPAYENSDKLALALIKALVARGDSSYNRYTFGVYDDRRVYYAAAPTDIAYYRRLADPAGQITTLAGQTVMPWSVRPGRWLFYPDWFVGRTEPATRREDSRFEFVESVTYTAPWSVQTMGGDVDTLSAVLAQLGLAGVGG